MQSYQIVLLYHILPSLCLRYVRIVGTHNTVNKVFHLVAFECMFTNRSFTLDNGLLGKFQTQRVFLNVEYACLVAHVFRASCFRSEARILPSLGKRRMEQASKCAGVRHMRGPALHFPPPISVRKALWGFLDRGVYTCAASKCLQTKYAGLGRFPSMLDIGTVLRRDSMT